MKSLIKTESAMEFLLENGSWTSEISKARVFSSLVAVHETKKEVGLKHFEHYVLQGDQISSLDFSFPLG